MSKSGEKKAPTLTGANAAREAAGGFEDHFSSRAAAYAKFRPTYPAALFSALSDHCPRHTRAWDCATGSGQAAVALAAHFDHITATDASPDQVRHATSHPRVHYEVARAEDAPKIEDASVDLVTVAAGVHWFDRQKFYTEVRRVSPPEGRIAVWSYGPEAYVHPAVDKVIRDLADTVVVDDWPAPVDLVRARYRTLDFPFDEVDVGTFECISRWTLAEVKGVLHTWSGVIRHHERTGDDAIEIIGKALEEAWPVDEGEALPVHIPLGLRFGRVHS